MLAVDKTRARELFSEISPKLPLPALTCEDALVYNVSEFYETLTRVAQTTFSQEEMKQDAHIYFVLRYVDAMSSPAQVTPIAKVITAIKPSQHQGAILIQSFSEALRKISNDDRSFTSWLRQAPYDGGSLRGLLENTQQQNIPSSNLRETVRTYLTNNLRAERCADSTNTTQQEIPAYIKYVNGNFFKANPILPDDINTVKLEGSIKTHSYWNSNQARQILAEVKSLSFNETGAPLTISDKETSEWQQKLMKLQGSLTEWNESQEESAADYFHQKSVVYLSLLNLAPNDLTRKNVLNSFIIFLRDSNMQRDSPVEWFIYVNRLLGRVRSFKNERSSMLETLSKSNSASLKLYCDLERLWA